MNKQKNRLIFYLFFTLYFLSLFISDLSLDENVVDMSSKLLKLCSFIIMFLYLLINFSKMKKLETTVILLFSLILLIASKDSIWLGMAFLAICSKTQTKETILKSSFWLLFLFTLFTLIGCLLGVLPDLINIRTANHTIRHSFGFYHSNVLPIILFYLTVYYCMIKENKTNGILLFIILLLDILLFFLCNSKNACLCTFLVLVISVLSKRKSKIKIWDRVIELTSKHIMTFFFLISYILMYFCANSIYIDVINVFDQLLSGRIYLSALKYNIVGVKFLNFMDAETFFSIQYTIDNGYIYTFLRYGVLAVILFIFINFSLINIYHKKKWMQLIWIIVVFANFIDNDLFSYGFLPFLIIGIGNISSLIERYGKKYAEKYDIHNHSHL